MHVVCVGLATVDLVQRVDRLPGLDEKAEAVSAEVAAGGPATNAAVTAAALGATVTLVTAVGAHPLGDLIRADLAAYGVTLLDATPDAVLIDGHHPALALAAARGGRPAVVDAGSWRPVFAQLLPRAGVVAASAAFRPPGESSVEDAMRALGVRRGAITHGPDPVRWWSSDEAGELAVPPVDAVDTAGAGDVLHGALAVALARDPDLVAALRFAIGVAGIRVRHAGPRAWLEFVTI